MQELLFDCWKSLISSIKLYCSYTCNIVQIGRYAKLEIRNFWKQRFTILIWFHLLRIFKASIDNNNWESSGLVQKGPQKPLYLGNTNKQVNHSLVVQQVSDQLGGFFLPSPFCKLIAPREVTLSENECATSSLRLPCPLASDQMNWNHRRCNDYCWFRILQDMF